MGLRAVKPGEGGRRQGGWKERLQTYHLPAVADGTLAQGRAGELFMAVTIVASLGRGDGAGGVIDAEDAATLRECGLAHAVAQEAVVADAGKAVGENVKELCGG